MQFSLLHLFGFVAVFAIVLFGLVYVPVYVLAICTNTMLCVSFAVMSFAALVGAEMYA